MKKSFQLLFAAAALAVGASLAHAGEVLSQAIVLKVTGAAQVSADGKSQPVDLKAGDKLSQGAVITGKDAKAAVVLQVFQGGVAVIAGKSEVALEKLSVTTEDGKLIKQTALLDDREGFIRSVIDENKGLNTYGIRTPKGVFWDDPADFTINVGKNSGTQMFVTTGSVTLKGTDGKDHTIPANSFVTVDPSGGVTVQSFSGSLAGVDGALAKVTTAFANALVKDTGMSFNSALKLAGTLEDNGLVAAYVPEGMTTGLNTSALTSAGNSSLSLNQTLGAVNPGITIPQSPSN